MGVTKSDATQSLGKTSDSTYQKSMTSKQSEPDFHIYASLSVTPLFYKCYVCTPWFELYFIVTIPRGNYS